MSEKYEKYKKAINKPQRAMKRAFDAVKDWSPENKWMQLVRVPTATVAFNLYLAMLLFTRIGLENPIIEKLDDINRNKTVNKSAKTRFGRFVAKIRKREKANPTLSAILVYYMMLTMLVGGTSAYTHKTNIKEFFKEWRKDNETDEDIEEEIEEAKQNTFAAYKEKLEPITPWLIAQLIAAEGVHMDEQGVMHTPYKDGNGIWTIGFGSTRLKDGSRVTKDTPPITTEEAYDLARWHLEEKETFFDLYCYSVADERLTVRNTGEAFGLSSIVYNSGTKFIEDENDKNHKERFELLRQKYAEYGAAIPDSVVAELFEKYPIRNKKSFGEAWIDSNDPQDMAKAIGLYMKDGNGMHWRRWLEAGLITGDITPEDLLECPIQGMYDFYMYMGGYIEYKPIKGDTKETIKRKNAELKKPALWEKTADGWIPRKSTYQAFKEWLKNPKTKDKGTGKEWVITRQRVKDFLPEYVLQECMNGKCEIGAVRPKKQTEQHVEKRTYTLFFEDLYKIAVNKYNAGDYDAAIEILENLIKTNPDNALLHNDLALMYNKIGEYDKAIEHARKIVHDIGDKSQYGAAQYNAGVAYEKKGDLENALKNYKLSLSNGNAEAYDAVKRVEKKLSKQKSKTIAFNQGIQNIKQSYQTPHVVYSGDNEFQA